MKIRVTGKGGKYLIGPLTREDYDYWKINGNNAADKDWTSEASLANIFGPDGEKSKLYILDNDGNIVEEKQLSEILVDSSKEWSNTIKSVEYCQAKHGGMCSSDEYSDHNEIPPYVFSVIEEVEGTFFEFDIDSFDVSLLQIRYVVVEDAEIFTEISYNNIANNQSLTVKNTLLETIEIKHD